jgi:hypothetical protein
MGDKAAIVTLCLGLCLCAVIGITVGIVRLLRSQEEDWPDLYGDEPTDDHEQNREGSSS